MRRRALSTTVAIVVLLAAIRIRASEPAASERGPYRVSQVFHVGGEGSYWDYVTIDPGRGLLYLSRGSHVMVLSIADGATVADIRGQDRNHGVALVPAAGRGFISDGDEGSVVVFDLATHAVLGKIKAEIDADEIVYDPVSDKVLVVAGDSNTLASISPGVNPKSGAVDASLNLGGKPGSFVVDRGKAYVNLADRSQVAVVDVKGMKVVERWSTAPGGEPSGIAMDPARRRLFIGCRNPQKVVVMNADDGRIIGEVAIGAGVDGILFDGDIFASCRDGTLAVIRETSPDRFELIQTLRTKPWAGTMGLDPRTHRIYLPTAEFAQPPGVKTRTAVIPDSFAVLVVSPTGK
ncbi:MAG: YncE family protein [Verrucomicrobia bacterium]|nr:YncE family protein [Verrucomicrobiota bacterium]